MNIINILQHTCSFPFPLVLPWNLRILSSSDRIQLGRIPQDKHLWYLHNINPSIYASLNYFWRSEGEKIKIEHQKASFHHFFTFRPKFYLFLLIQRIKPLKIFIHIDTEEKNDFQKRLAMIFKENTRKNIFWIINFKFIFTYNTDSSS